MTSNTYTVRCIECEYFYPFSEYEGYCELTGKLVEGNYRCSKGREVILLD